MKFKTFFKIFIVMQLFVIVSNVNATTPLGTNQMQGMNTDDIAILDHEIAPVCHLGYLMGPANVNVNCMHLTTCLDNAGSALIRQRLVKTRKLFTAGIEAIAGPVITLPDDSNFDSQKAIENYIQIVRAIQIPKCLPVKTAKQ